MYKSDKIEECSIKIPLVDQSLEKPRSGHYSEGFIKIDKKKYLIKKPNRSMYPNNEVYLAEIVKFFLGEENSTHYKLAYEENNADLRKITLELEQKIKIASLWIEGTKNLMEVEINLSKKPKNLIGIFFLSVLINNIDPNPENILFDEVNQKFYLIDPLVMSSENRPNVDIGKFYLRIDELYEKFLENLKRDNIKEKIATLLNEYFRTYYELFYLKIVSYIKKTYQDHQDLLERFNKLGKKNEELLRNNTIPTLINLLTTDEVIEEINQIRSHDENEFKEIGEFFENIEVFENFGSKGVQNGHMNMILNRLERLSQINLSENSQSS